MKLPNLKILPFILACTAFLTLNGCDGTTGTLSNEPLAGSTPGASTPAVSVDINDLPLGYKVTGTSMQGEENNSSINFLCDQLIEFDGDSLISWSGVSYYNIVGDVIAWIPEEADMNLSTAEGGTPGRLEVGATYFLEGPNGPNENWTILDIQKTNCEELPPEA